MYEGADRASKAPLTTAARVARPYQILSSTRCPKAFRHSSIFLKPFVSLLDPLTPEAAPVERRMSSQMFFQPFCHRSD